MTLYYLMNNIRVGSTVLYAGTQIDDTAEDAAKIRNAGGALLLTTTPGLAAGAALAQSRRKQGAPPEELESIMNGAIEVQQQANPQRGTLAIATGTGTVAAGITVTAASRIFATLKGRPTGSVNFAGHAVTARTPGAPGVGAFTVEFLQPDGAIDADSAGAVDWEIWD